MNREKNQQALSNLGQTPMNTDENRTRKLVPQRAQERGLQAAETSARRCSLNRTIASVAFCGVNAALRARPSLRASLECGDSSPYLFSPNGADPYQPRAERSAALGWMPQGKSAQKGRPIGGAALENGSPLQGWDLSPPRTQGGALGWDGTAPLGLSRYKSPPSKPSASPIRVHPCPSVVKLFIVG